MAVIVCRLTDAGIADADDAGSAWLEAPLDRKRAVIDALAVVTLLRGGVAAHRMAAGTVVFPA